MNSYIYSSGSLRFFLGIAAKSNIHKKKHNQQQSCSYLCTVSKINKIHSSNSSILAATNKQIIPNVKSLINKKNTIGAEISTKLGVINATPNHPAAKLVNNPERTFSQDLVKNISIKVTT